MTDRIRRAFKMPRRETSDTFVDEMKASRKSAVEQSRETIRSIHRLEEALNVIKDGADDYDEFNRIMFGRSGWQRRGEPQP